MGRRQAYPEREDLASLVRRHDFVKDNLALASVLREGSVGECEVCATTSEEDTVDVLQGSPERVLVNVMTERHDLCPSCFDPFHIRCCRRVWASGVMTENARWRVQAPFSARSPAHLGSTPASLTRQCSG